MLKRKASQRTNLPSIKQWPDLTNYVIIITVYRENNMEFINTICGQNVGYLTFKHGVVIGLRSSGNFMQRLYF